MDAEYTKGYLVEAETQEIFEFQYNPSTISDEKSSAYATIKIPGMSHPRYQFISGEARKIQFTLKLFGKNVKKNASWLQSLQYPEYENGVLKKTPHPVIFILGDLYPGTTCIVRSVKVIYSKLFDKESLLPLNAEVSITLEESVKDSVNYLEVRS